MLFLSPSVSCFFISKFRPNSLVKTFLKLVKNENLFFYIEFFKNNNKTFYKKFSKNCNEYFYIPHRNERRGIGGIFFDNFKQLGLEKTLLLLSDTASQYKNSYTTLANLRRQKKYTKSQKDFQLLRRGRYAEFNLVYDRGTAFGLQSNGRIESILASLPSDVKWSYKKTKEHEAMEKRLLKYIDMDWNV